MCNDFMHIFTCDGRVNGSLPWNPVQVHYWCMCECVCVCFSAVHLLSHYRVITLVQELHTLAARPWTRGESQHPTGYHVTACTCIE